MKSYLIKTDSKNKNSIAKFYWTVFNRKNININSLTIKKKFKNKNSKNFVSVLKSPHVNKKAQEQLEIRNFSKQFIISTTNSVKFIYFIKKLKNVCFPDVKVQITFLSNKKKEKLFLNKLLHLNNFKSDTLQKNKSNTLKSVKKNKKKIVARVTTLLKLLDAYGELVNRCLDSSVGRAKD